MEEPAGSLRLSFPCSPFRSLGSPQAPQSASQQCGDSPGPNSSRTFADQHSVSRATPEASSSPFYHVTLFPHLPCGSGRVEILKTYYHSERLSQEAVKGQSHGWGPNSIGGVPPWQLGVRRQTQVGPGGSPLMRGGTGMPSVWSSATQHSLQAGDSLFSGA